MKWICSALLLTLAITGPHTIQRFYTGDAPASLGSLSADGHWMTYVSSESGRLEVYVRPYPGPGPALQISTAGGDEPCWAGRGLELMTGWLAEMVAKPVGAAG